MSSPSSPRSPACATASSTRFAPTSTPFRAEQGCLAYQAVVDVRDAAPGFAQFGPDSFIVVEQWSSLEALQAHAVAPHMKAYASKVKELTANRAIHVLEPA